MQESLTVILPMHNAQAQMRREIEELVDIAADLTHRFMIVVIDDGSTDDTFDVASELAATLRQVRVVRRSVRRGLGPTLDSVRKAATEGLVCVHDGVSPIDAEELRALWLDYRLPRRQQAHEPSGPAWRRSRTGQSSNGGFHMLKPTARSAESCVAPGAPIAHLSEVFPAATGAAFAQF